METAKYTPNYGRLEVLRQTPIRYEFIFFFFIYFKKKKKYNRL